jgi:magnesium and cobalt transporter
MTHIVMNDDYTPSQKKKLFTRLKNFIQGEPQNKSELAAVIHEANQRAVINEDTTEMIQGVLGVTSMKVRDIMIPRSQIVAIQKNLTPEAIMQTVINTTHSRFPVIHDDKDHIEGILLAKDLLKYSFENKHLDFSLHDVIRPAVVVPESKRVDVLLKEFRSKRYHMAIVVDEYGGVSGLITIEDILEEIVGDIEDEYDIEHVDKHNIQALSEHKYKVNALTPIEDFNSFFHTTLSDEEFDTIGGLITHAFGRLPAIEEELTLGEFHVKVIKADTRRLIEVEVCKINS